MNGEPDIRRIGRWIIPASLAALSVALFLPGIFGGKVPVFRDLLVLVIPLRHFAREAVRSGILPLWTNDLFFGAPFLANYQSAVLYPPSALLYALPFSTGLSLYLAFHLFVGGWGMARYLERRHGLSALCAAFGALVFCVGGYTFSVVPLANQLAVAAWLPWALSAAEELRATGKTRSFLQLTVVLSLQMLCGAPEPLLMTLALIMLPLVRGLLRREQPLGRSLAVVACVVLAASLSAVQVLPALEYVLETDRARGLGYDRVSAESIAPFSLLQLLIPHVFTNGGPGFIPEGTIPLFWSLYFGILPLGLAAAALASRPLSSWSLVFWAAIVLVMGSHTPVFSALYEMAPRIVGLFRFPGKFFLANHFVVSLLAARALADVERGRPMAKVAALGLGTIAALTLSIAVTGTLAPSLLLDLVGYRIPVEVGDSTRSLLASGVGLIALRSAALAVLGLLLLRFFARGRISARTFGLAAVALGGADLVLVHQPTLVFADWSSLRQAGEARARSMEPGDRVFHYCVGCLPEGAGIGSWSGGLIPGEPVAERAAALWASLVPDAPMVYGLGAVAGSDGLSTTAQREVFQKLAELPRERAVHLLASLGVSHLVGPRPLEPLRELGIASEATERSLAWQYAVTGASPRMYLAEAIFTAPDWIAALDRLAEPEFRPGRDAVVVGEAPRIGSPGAAGEIDDVRYAAGSIEARLQLTAPALWVVSDTWFPGWEGRIDGAPAEMLRVNGIFRGLAVPAGPHHVTMEYRPRSVRIGGALSMIAIAVLLVLAVRTR